MTMRTRTFLLLCLLAVAPMLGGCWSANRAMYKSTPWQPTTVTVVDATDFEAYWSYDIPVGHSLVVDFAPAMEQTKSPTSLAWSLYEGDDQRFMQDYPQKGKVSSGKVDLPGVPVKLNVTFRPAPEVPGSMPPEETAAPVIEDEAGRIGEPGEAPTEESTIDQQIEQEVESAERSTEVREEAAETTEEVTEEPAEEPTNVTEEPAK